MTTESIYDHINRDLLTRVSANLVNEEYRAIDYIPLEMTPKDSKAHKRCCVYKDRAILKHRIMAILGYSIEDEQDELKLLSAYAEESLWREKPDNKILTIINEACHGCVQVDYFITNVCQGCLSRPCIANCPKAAIVMERGHAVIEQDTCINCGLCQKVCPYHAIVHLEVPCEAACPVNAISRDVQGKEIIDFEKCIFCGRCQDACPFGAIVEKSHIVDILKYIKAGRKIIALIAPAVAGQFPVEISQLIAGIKKLGFAEVIEVARGADITTANEAKELEERLAQGQLFMTTSCCPAYKMAVEKHIPELRPFVSETKSPLCYTAEIASQEHPEAMTVFVSPCLAKKKEAQSIPHLDFVLSVDELSVLFLAKHIALELMEPTTLQQMPSRQGRGYAISGGVAGSIKALLPQANPVLINGLSQQTLRDLKNIAAGNVTGNLVEVMTCEQGCVGGTHSLCAAKIASKRINNLTKV
jgi:[FeFe] hydrogenase (group B1/B3)